MGEKRRKGKRKMRGKGREEDCERWGRKKKDERGGEE